MTQRYAFLGPQGTFCEQALHIIAPADATCIPAPDVSRAIWMVCDGETDYAAVPIENSVEGGINATLDALAARNDLAIYAEMLVDIAFTLAVRPGTKLADIQRIATHQAAWTQCRSWLAQHLPDVLHVPAASTAAGAQMLAEGNKDIQAALVSPLAAERYGLEELYTGVADNPDAVTRFVLIGRAGPVPNPTGSDKTTLMVQLPNEEPGALLTMLEQFSARGVNLSRIESRPVGDHLGRYAFSLDAEGHLYDERIQAVMRGLHRTCPSVIFLGSYPTADRHTIATTAWNDDASFTAARDWVRSLVNR